MEAEDLVLNDSCQRQVVEKFCECFPDTWISILPQAFIVEAINAIDFTAFVVTSQEEEVLLVLHLVGEEQNNGLD